MTEDEMVGWHHQRNGHAFEKTLGDGEGQGSLACCVVHGVAKCWTRLSGQKTQNKLIEKEIRLLVIRGKFGVGEIERSWSEVTNFQL